MLSGSLKVAVHGNYSRGDAPHPTPPAKTLDDMATAQSRKGTRHRDSRVSRPWRAIRATGTHVVAKEVCSVIKGHGHSLGRTADQQRRMPRKRGEQRGGKLDLCDIMEAKDFKCLTNQRHIQCCQLLCRGWKGKWLQL